MSVPNDHQASHSEAEDAWTYDGSDFVLIAEGKPPPRIELAKERLLICRPLPGIDADHNGRLWRGVCGSQ
jgi:hypothetical protein